MKSIPSLIATSTVGVAATGLVFGQHQVPTPSSAHSGKRKATEYDMDNRLLSSPRSRPATSPITATPSRTYAQTTSSFARSTPNRSQPDNYTAGAVENGAERIVHSESDARRMEVTTQAEGTLRGRRESHSSNRTSWMRRLSTIQLSSQGSPRSSIGHDSPSLTFSNGSVAPILHANGTPSPLPPNKLVKRSTSVRVQSEETPSKRGMRSHIPTLRRPATSHQRSYTLRQLGADQESSVTPSGQRSVSAPVPQGYRVGDPAEQEADAVWRPYFVSRPLKAIRDRTSSRSVDSGADIPTKPARRVILPDSFTPPVLTKAAMVAVSDDERVPKWIDGLDSGTTGPMVELGSPDVCSSPIVHPQPDREVRPRRTISMPLSSPPNWISRSGSLRGLRRGGNTKDAKRHVSNPDEQVPARPSTPAHVTSNLKRNGNSDIASYISPLSNNTHGDMQSLPQSPNRSSPLPSFSRFSSFNLDQIQADSGPPSKTSLQNPTSPQTPTHPILPFVKGENGKPSTKGSARVVIHQAQRTPTMPVSDKASTLVGPDCDVKDAAFGEDDDTDFQSESAFDSYRTGTSASLRTRGSPLESMFDDSPPYHSHKGNSLGARDIIANGAFRDSIVEEDEGSATPVKFVTAIKRDTYHTPIRNSIEMDIDEITQSPTPCLVVGTRDFARMSLDDDDEEEDWTKDDEIVAITNPLSPPSNSLNARRINPLLKAALADGPSSDTALATHSQGEDQPRSLFDWSEPIAVENRDPLSDTPRPKTVHGKRLLDHRGGRAVGRNRPSALHVRSQSVPVVPDVAGQRERKLAPKFGTWGLGGKGVDEDWDNDFEFEGIDADGSEKTSMNGSGMLVPPAIQASQAIVAGHVGQIREVCLLVEHLKRLRGQAKEKGLLDGSSAELWREAEGIIALAIPDEEDEALSPALSPTPVTLEDEDMDDFGIDEIVQKMGPSFVLDSPAQPTNSLTDGVHMRRRSVFSPDDDIFGAGGVAAAQRLGEEQAQSSRTNRSSNTRGSTDVARSVMENIHQHRAISDPLRTDSQTIPQKMPFDTTSLRDLVQRANTLTRILAEIIRKAEDDEDQHAVRTPQHPARDSSPAFTRVFSEPPSSPPIHLPRSQSNNSTLSGSIDGSPSHRIEKRLQMMAVG